MGALGFYFYFIADCEREMNQKLMCNNSSWGPELSGKYSNM